MAIGTRVGSNFQGWSYFAEGDRDGKAKSTIGTLRFTGAASGSFDGSSSTTINIPTVAGPQGARGSTGSTGSQGVQGIRGSNGSTGAQGVQGIRGSSGSTGSTGLQGTQGPIGPRGSNGSNGAQGTQGPRGTSGSNGTQGAQGPTGPRGSNGSNGSQGTQGIQGTRGGTGSRGLQGTQGARGISETIDATGNVANSVVKRSGTSINTAGGFFQRSDDRVKTYLNDFIPDPKLVDELIPRLFKYNEGDGTTHLGLSAQEVLQICPYIVNVDEDGYMSIDYSKVSLLLMDKIHRTADRLSDMEERLSRLENLIK